MKKLIVLGTGAVGTAAVSMALFRDRCGGRG